MRSLVMNLSGRINMWTIMLVMLFPVILGGCSGPLHPVLYGDATRVQFQRSNSLLLGDCKKLGPVSAHGRCTFLGEAALDDAKRGLRNQAAQMGGDTVVITNLEGDIVIECIAQAVIFRCY